VLVTIVIILCSTIFFSFNPILFVIWASKMGWYSYLKNALLVLHVDNKI
jgi:hypothetical protein